MNRIQKRREKLDIDVVGKRVIEAGSLSNNETCDWFDFSA